MRPGLGRRNAGRPENVVAMREGEVHRASWLVVAMAALAAAASAGQAEVVWERSTGG